MGVPYDEVRQAFGDADAQAGDVRWTLYRYAGIEVIVDGVSGVVRSFQADVVDGYIVLPAALGLGGAIATPSRRADVIRMLEELGIAWEAGKFHVPGPA